MSPGAATIAEMADWCGARYSKGGCRDQVFMLFGTADLQVRSCSCGLEDDERAWRPAVPEEKIMSPMKVAVIGGGIRGLSAALHLLKAALDVHVYEQAPRVGEIGAGIQISPNASRLLIRLGLKPALDKVGVRPLAVHQRRWDDGRPLQRAPLGPEVEATFGAPYY